MLPDFLFVDRLNIFSKQGTLPYLSCGIQFSSLLATNASQLPHVFLDLRVTLSSCKFPQGWEALCDPHIQPNGSHVVLWPRAASHNEVRAPDTVPRKHSYSMADACDRDWCFSCFSLVLACNKLRTFRQPQCKLFVLGNIYLSLLKYFGLY